MKIEITDKLISKLQQSDSHAFHAIYTSYYKSLCIFAHQYLQDRDDAEDMVQESFASLWDNRQQMQNSNHVRSFLYQTTKNRCLNVLKHQIVKENYQKRTDATDDHQIYEETLIQSEVTRLLHDSIILLPKKRQRIVLMSMEGLKNSEIAEEMSISVNTVKLQKKLAYDFLRKRLKDVALNFLL